jgi:acyl transferase domain-containing protein
MTMFKVPESVDDLDIAIIGMACRFPGAASLDQYWRNLAGGVESITCLTAEQLKDAGVDPARIDDPAFVKASSTLEGVDRFDAGFFGYSPREARQMDPQSRQFLECAWEAFESSGYNPRSLSATVGVFAAQSLSTYLLGAAHHTFESREFSPRLATPAVLGNGGDFLRRASPLLHLNGPSVNQTAARARSWRCISRGSRSSAASATWRLPARCRSTFRSRPGTCSATA